MNKDLMKETAKQISILYVLDVILVIIIAVHVIFD